jgi:D-glycero-D-manno-heptose 1,7-bisphosphate phosphatase
VASAAVFLDRDGTIIEDTGYLHEPGKVKLLPGAAEAIHRLNTHGFLVITVTNQSGIARGMYTVAEYAAVQRRLTELLAAPPHDAHLDGSYFCPHHPRFTGPCDCRKPALKLFRDAAAAFDIDLARSWWVGDRVPDVQPALQFGSGPPVAGTAAGDWRVRGVLVATGQGNLHQGKARALGVTVVADLAEAVDHILGDC